MTRAQINLILNEIGGYQENTLIEPGEISEVILGTNENIYADEGTFLYFDGPHELLIVYDRKVEDGVVYHNEFPRDIIDYYMVDGFMLKTYFFPRAPYKYGRQV